LPERFDLMGVISLVAQILGLTWENLRQRIVRFVGERGVQVLEFVASYVQTLIEGGWAGLWERIQNDLAMLRDMVLQQIRNYLVERIILGAVTRLATMFNPVGALVNILIAAYQFYTFIRDQLQRIMQIVTTLVDAVSNIAQGLLGPAQEGIERFLAGLLPLAIDLLARLLGLGDVSARVREILTSVQQTIWGAIDRLIERVVGLFRGGGQAGAQPAAEGTAGAPAAGGAAQIGERIPVPTAEGTHSLYIVRVDGGAQEMVESTPMTVAARIADWRTRQPSLPDTVTPPETESRRAAAARLLTQADTELGQVDQLADALAAQSAVAPRPGTPAPATPAPAPGTPAPAVDPERQVLVTQEERQLGAVLGQLFNVFGETLAGPGQLAQRFAGNIAAAHPQVQEGLRTAVRALEIDVPAGESSTALYGDWQTVRDAIERSHTFREGARGGNSFREFISRPLAEGTSLSGSFPSDATRDIAVAGLRQAISAAPTPPPAGMVALPADFNVESFVQGQKASLHDALPPYARSVFSIRAVIWDERAQSAAVRTLGEELYRRAADPASRPGADNETKIDKYRAMYTAAGLTAPARPAAPISDQQVDDYRRTMRDAIAREFARTPLDMPRFNVLLDDNTLFEGGYNRIRGEILEAWIVLTVPGVQDLRPVFRLPPSNRRVDGDRIQGSEIIEAKAISSPRSPEPEEQQQITDYATIIRGKIKGLLVDRSRKHVGETPEITGIVYVFNRGSVAVLWVTALSALPSYRILIGSQPYDPNQTYTD
jgi:hypothetical protein